MVFIQNTKTNLLSESQNSVSGISGFYGDSSEVNSLAEYLKCLDCDFYSISKWISKLKVRDYSIFLKLWN